MQLGLLISCISLSTMAMEMRIIGGKEVSQKDFPELASARMDSSACSAVVVGPNAALTAAHCATDLQPVRLVVQGEEFEGIAHRHPLYPASDLDLVVIKTAKEMEVVPATVSVGAGLKLGDKLQLVGFGCTGEGGAGHPFTALVAGEAEITGFGGFDITTKGSALCFGDSGSPSLIERNGHRVVVGVGSKGNLKDTSYHTQVDRKEAHDFLRAISEREGLQICGINLDC